LLAKVYLQRAGTGVSAAPATDWQNALTATVRLVELEKQPGARIEWPWTGGGQEHGRRGGTENVAGAAGLGTAARLAMARLPATASHVFARMLDAVTGPFHWVNYLGSCAGAKIFPARRMAGKMDQVTRALQRRLRAETSARLRSGMHYPVRWDPFFKDFMTLADIYRYPTQHFDFHEQQLTLGQTASRDTPA